MNERDRNDLTEHLTAARKAGWEADLALAQADLKAAQVQVEMAAAHFAACRKILLAASLAPTPKPQ